MPSLATMQVVITILAALMACVSFGLYVAMTLNWLKPDTQKKTEDNLQAAGDSVRSMISAPSAADVADMLKALASLTDNLVKAGPALWSLIGSALFLLIAAIAAGLLVGGSSDEASTGNDTSAAANASTANDAAADENLPV